MAGAAAHRVNKSRKTTEPVLAKMTPLEEVTAAFGVGKKLTVTPRDGEATELYIRPFYTDQVFRVIDQLEKVFLVAKEVANMPGMSDDTGNTNLQEFIFEIFRRAREEAMILLAEAIEQDRTWVGLLEVDDLLEIFSIVFVMNKDFFEQRVKTKIQAVIAQISLTL